MDINLSTRLVYSLDLRTFCFWVFNRGLLKNNPSNEDMTGNLLIRKIMKVKGGENSILYRKDYNGALTWAEAHKFWSIVPKYILSNYPCNNFSSVDYTIQYQIA